MSVRFPLKYRALVTTTCALALVLAACTPFAGLFGKKDTPSPEPVVSSVSSQPPGPGGEPLATPTLTPVPPTPIPTSTATEEPTATSEVEAAAKESVALEATATVTPTVEVATGASVALETAATVTPTVEAATGASAAPEAMAATTPTVPLVAPASLEVSVTGNVIANGGFEDGFDQNGVAQGWTTFSTSKDSALYVWQDETDAQHIAHGKHALLMRIMGPGEPNTFMGIYQTVKVVAGETYTLAVHGLIRSSTASENYTPLAFRLQMAIVDGGPVDWQTVGWDRWTDLGWNDVALNAKWPGINAYVVPFTPQSDTVTLLIRGWSKWALFQSEAKFYVDSVSLEGPLPSAKAAAAPPVEQEQVWLPTTGGSLTGMIAVAGAILILGLAVWKVRKDWMRSI